MSGRKFAVVMAFVALVTAAWAVFVVRTTGTVANKAVSVVAAALTPEAVPAVIEPPATPAPQGQEPKALPVIIGRPDMEILARRVARLAVLKQFVTEQEAALAAEQDKFCTQYGLDVGKLRAGRYNFSLKDGKVVER